MTNPEPRWKVGNEYAPFHPQASHIRPDYRDGWNDCYEAALTVVRDAALEEAAKKCEQVGRETGECPEMPDYCADAIRALKGTA